MIRIRIRGVEVAMLETFLGIRNAASPPHSAVNPHNDAVFAPIYHIPTLLQYSMPDMRAVTVPNRSQNNRRY